MIKKSHRRPKGVHTPFSNYSHSVVVDGAQRLIFTAGQVAGDANGNIIGVGDFAAQAKQVMENIGAILTDAGATFADVTKITIYVVDPNDVAKGRDILTTYFPDNPPASTLCVLRGLAHPGFLVEVEATAVV